VNQRFDLDAIRALYDMRQVYPASEKRRDYGHYTLEICRFHDDTRPSMLIGKNGYKCKTCEAKGDVLTWVMLGSNLTFPEAAKALRDGTANLNVVPGPYQGRPAAPPPIYHPDEATGFADGMTDADYERLTDLTGIQRPTAESHTIGRYDYGIYTIPVRNPSGDSWGNIKLYRPGADKTRGQIKMWSLKEGAPNMLYGMPYLNGDSFVVIVGGEKDAILGHQMHLPFVTDTAGENSWSHTFNGLLAYRHIYAFLDADRTGRAGMLRIRKKVPRAILCDWRLLWRSGVPQGYDFGDFVREGGTREQFLEMLRRARSGIYDVARPAMPPQNPITADGLNMQEMVI
jgi:hypothetical protein